MRKGMSDPQIRAWAQWQAEMRSVRRFMVVAAGSVLDGDLEEAQSGLVSALESLKRARVAHARWAGE